MSYQKKVKDKIIYNMFINGEWDYSEDRDLIPVENPSDESIIAYIQLGTDEDAEKVLETAQQAQPSWEARPPRERGEILYRFADMIMDHQEELAHLITDEQGKLLELARGEVAAAASFIRYACEGARRIEGDIFPSDRRDEQIWIQRVPYGVTLGITAWNFPLALAARKLGPALIAGNVMVLKPPLETPLSTIRICDLAADAGIPPGVLSIVTGSGPGLGNALVKNKKTKLITMTGSSQAGRIIQRAASENLTAVRLELGGKAPFTVFPDADLRKAARDACFTRFVNCGQICTCNERLYIHNDIYDEFMVLFYKEVDQLKLGNPKDPTSSIGPKITRKQLENMQELVDRAVQEGARVERGGRSPLGDQFKKGFWFEPTILSNVRQDMSIVHEEAFGPILPVLRFNTFEEAIELANDCDYGLSAYVYTYDMRKIMRLKQELEFGEIYVNHETGEQHQGFHNGYKLSGTGGEDGKYGFENYMEKKTFYINWEET